MTPIRTEPLTLLAPSPTNPRKRFPPEGIAELAETIARHGVLQPILVRRRSAAADGTPPLEIVAGERRWRACCLLTEQGRNPHGEARDSIPVIERELVDAEVLAVQLIENIEREDLHPLEEAEHYRRMREDAAAPRTVEQIAEIARISPQRVYDRLQLLHLVPEASESYLADKLTLKTALQVSRLPAHHQAEAVKHLADWGGEPMGNKAAQAFLRDRFMLRLEHAPFDVADATLVAPAGACTACPKRTGANAQLFADITDADLCTDSTCFAGKKEAQQQRLLAQMRTSGYRVLEGDEARRACAPDGRGLGAGWLALEQQVPVALGDSSLKVAEVLQRAKVPNADIVTVPIPSGGTVVHAVSAARLEAALKRIKAHRTQIATDKPQSKAPAAAKVPPTGRVKSERKGEHEDEPAGEVSGTLGPAAPPSEELVEELLDFHVPLSTGHLDSFTAQQEARARGILAAASVVRTMLTDRGAGLPEGGELPRMLAALLVWSGAMYIEAAALHRLCSTREKPASKRRADVLQWAGALDDEEACRVLMAMVALQTVNTRDSADPLATFWRSSAELVGAPVERIEEQARTAVANRIRLASMANGKPATKAGRKNSTPEAAA